MTVAIALLIGLAGGGLIMYFVGRESAKTPSPEPIKKGPPRPARRDSAKSLRDPLTQAVDRIEHGVVVVDSRGDEMFRNSAAVAVAEARDSRALVESRVQELLAQALGGKAKRSTVELFGPPSQVFEVSSFQVEIGSGVGALALIEDRTETKRTETIRRDFVANISHELKSPVGALGLLAETLLDEDDPEVRERLAKRMVSETSRAARTIDDLLELSRIEFGEDSDFQDLEVAALVAEAVERIENTAEQANVAISIDGDSGILVHGDRRQLVSAMYNLLENAVKYSIEGSDVQLTFTEDSIRRAVEVVVEDHGVGIPKLSLDRIFERFYRVDPARSRHTGGTGLGLSIVRHVAANHGGQIQATSVEGQGSRFVLVLPARPREN